MMTRIFTLYTLLFISLMGQAEEYPVSLQKYDSDYYIKSFVQKEGIPKKELSSHLGELKKNATRGLASQIALEIKESAKLNKEAINGRSTIVYQNSSTFQTDVKLELVETDYFFDKKNKVLIVVAFIEKSKACAYYENEISRLNIEMDGFLANVENLVNLGEVALAKQTLEKDMPDIALVNNWEQRLSIFGYPRSQLIQISAKNSAQKQRVNELNNLMLSSALVYLKYPENYGEGDQTLISGVKGCLAKKGFRFTINEDKALWYVSLNSSVRHHKEVYGVFFSYVNVEVNLVNQKSAQQIYQEILTQKGGDSSFEQAAMKAYKELGNKVGEQLYIQMSK